ncbi:hypothetical protein RI138_10885 [Streptomyces sp. C11-1]|uniref:Secreted protein n=1 Tax=Streptomyces durocortorensis TaxID=2811104 RepID=A0ABY9VUP2_9ACTN|nr:hypothetical protein [Streptomyces durocortorensis]WNF27300.1 hypothetical protein RI138_10885 [Streptomyces durocortorensis]
MPRPTAAQFAYGSATVVVTALALLLLFRTESGVGVAAIGTASLVLGLLAALTLPAATKSAAPTAAATRTHRALEEVGARERVPAARPPAPPSAPTSARAGEHSLRR